MKLKDIAKEAGVSQTTVSLVLANKGRISEQVRAHVIAVANRLGYKKGSRFYLRPDSKLTNIGILLDIDPEWEFAWRITRSIIVSLEKFFSKNNYKTTLIPINLQEPTDSIFSNVLSANVGAIFTIHYSNEELFDRLEAAGIPVVIINNSEYQNKFYSVCVDDFQGAYEGALYLLDCGHKNIVYVDFKRPDMPGLVTNRYIGFRKAVDEHSIEFSEDCRITTELLNMDDLLNKLRSVFSKDKRPTAIFAHDDYLAANIVAVLNKMDLRIPADVSLIAHGDVLNYHQPFIPQITTMQINTDLMGTIAAELMLKRLNNDLNDLHHVLKVNQKLVDRGSCRCL